jgi:hypothetical protein
MHALMEEVDTWCLRTGRALGTNSGKSVYTLLHKCTRTMTFEDTYTYFDIWRHTLTFEDSFEDTYIRWGGGYLHIWYTVTLQHKCTRTYSANVEHKCTRTLSFKKTNASHFGDILVLFLVFFSSVIFYFCTSGSCRLFWKVSWYWHCSVNVLGHWLLRFFFQRFCTSGIRRWSTGTWSLRICSSRVTAALRFEKQK